MVRLGHKREEREDDDEGPRVTPFGDNPDALQALQSGQANVLGGTAWLWARPEFASSVDVLFVDEAGQMSLANALRSRDFTAPAYTNMPPTSRRSAISSRTQRRS